MVTTVHHEETVTLARSDARAQVVNRIVGTILAVEGDRLLHVLTDEGGSVALHVVECVVASELRPFLSAGRRVLITVDAADVKLIPHRSNGGQHIGNEWPARIVLIGSGRTVITVKIRGQQITLNSLYPKLWDARRLAVWDSVVVSIAPEAIHVNPLGTCARLHRRMLMECDSPR